MEIRVDHLQLAAPPDCEAAARDFFGRLMGLGEIAKPAALAGRGGVWFALGDGRQIHIGVVPVAEFHPAGKAHPGLRVQTTAELERLAGALVEADRPVVWAPEGEFPGLRRFHTTDPWGNRLEFLADE